jgi:predicted nucleic acid-binding protein
MAAFRQAEDRNRDSAAPNEAIVREAVRGCAAYQLNWFDAYLWSYAEHYGLPEILTEDFQHDRLYGTVRAVNPFVGLR